MANVGLMIATLCDNAKLEQHQTELQNEMTVVAEMTERCVYENARVALDQEEYHQSRYDGLVDFVTVYSTKDIWVTFKDGTEIKA